MSNHENKNCSELLLTNGMGLDGAPVKFLTFQISPLKVKPPNVGVIKVVLKFSSGYPKWHFWAHKDGHFWQKCPYWGTKKWYFGCPNENSFATFISPTSPKNDGIAFGFKRLSLLGWF